MFVGALSRYPPHVHRGWRYESWELDLPFSPLLQPARDGRAVDQGGRKPPTGPGYPVIGSGPTRSASYSGSSPTTSAICCVGSSCPSPSRAGPSRVSSSACSRLVDASSDMAGTSSCSWQIGRAHV